MKQIMIAGLSAAIFLVVNAGAEESKQAPPKEKSHVTIAQLLEEAFRAGDWDAVIRRATKLHETTDQEKERQRAIVLRACARLMKEDRKSALTDFETLVRMMPQNAEGYRNAAVFLYRFSLSRPEIFKRLQLFDVLEAHCTAGIEMGEKDEKTHKLVMAQLHQIRGSLRWNRAGDPTDAPAVFDDLKKAYRFDPKDREFLPPILQGMAKTAMPFFEHLFEDNRDLDRLVELAAPVLDDEEVSNELKHTILAFCCRFLFEGQRYREAAGTATKAIEMGRRGEDMYGARAGCYDALEEHRKAVDDYSVLLEITEIPQRRVGYLVYRGTAYSKLNENTEALLDFEEALRLDPKNVTALIWRAWFRIGAKNFDGGLDDCRQALAVDPNQPDVFMAMGHAHVGKEDFEKAAGAYGRAFELDGGLAEAVWLRARCYNAIGENKKALADFSKAAELDPKSYREVFEEFERVYHAIYDFDYPAEQAVEYLTEWIAKNPGVAELFVSRALRYVQQESWKKALDDYTEVVRLLPEDPEIRRDRFVVCLNLWGEPEARSRSVCDAAVEDITKMLGAIPHDDVDMERKELLYYRAFFIATRRNTPKVSPISRSA